MREAYEAFGLQAKDIYRCHAS